MLFITLEKMLPMAGPSRARMTITTTATNTRISAYSTKPWPSSRLVSAVPSEGLRRNLAAPASSPPRGPSLLGSVALQSVVCNEVSGCSGYLIPLRRSSFPSRPCGLPLATVPQSFRLGFILSCAFRPSRASRVTARSAEPSTSHGLPSLIATSTGGVHDRGRPRPTPFRPRRFARPRRLPPPPILRVCFTPLPRPGFALQGLPLARSRAGSSPAVALLSFAPAPCPQFDPTAPGNSARLQGFSPLASPWRTMVV